MNDLNVLLAPSGYDLAPTACLVLTEARHAPMQCWVGSTGHSGSLFAGLYMVVRNDQVAVRPVSRTDVGESDSHGETLLPGEAEAFVAMIDTVYEDEGFADLFRFVD